MEQAQIDQLKGMWDRERALAQEFKERQQQLADEKRKLEDACDHKFADGTSAWNTGGMFYTFCEICSANDM